MKRRWIQRNGKLIEVPTDYVAPSVAPYVIPDTPEYTSPIDGRLISGRAQRREDLKRSGSRPYEGREQEMKEAARQQQYVEQKLESSLERAAREAWHQLTPDKRRLFTG